MNYFLLLAVGLACGAGDLLIYRWAKTNQSLYLATALLIWAMGLVLFGLLLRGGGRSLGTTFVLTIVVHATLILGWDLFVIGSRWSKAELAGIALCVAGVLLIESATPAASAEKEAKQPAKLPIALREKTQGE